MKYSPEHIEALKVLEAGLREHGYRVEPFELRGQPSREPGRTHGVAFLCPKADPARTDLVHNIQLSLYLGPPRKHEPTIHSFHIDHYGIGQNNLLHPKLQAKLGFPKTTPFLDREGNVVGYTENSVPTAGTGWNTDLFVLPHELVAFAAWLPGWVDWLRSVKPYPAPPFPLDRGEQVWFYTWSRAAMATYRAFTQVVAAVRGGTRPPVESMS